MSEKDVIKETRPRMEGAVEDLRRKLATVRTGRAAVSLLDSIVVEYYGTPTPLSQMASVHAPEPQMLTVQPWDQTQIGAIEKAILASDLGITPNNDGKVIRLAFPQLTEDRRKELIKVAHVRAEEGRVAVRGVRRHAKQELERMKKDHKLSEDEERGAEGQLQKLTDKYVTEVDANLKRKEAELSEV